MGELGEPRGARASSESLEAGYQERVWGDLRRNYAVHVFHGLLGRTGFQLINAPTFIPSYLFLLSGSDVVVGAARGLQYFGMFLSPIWSAALIEHRRRVLPVGLSVGALMRLQVLGIALAGLWLSGTWQLLATCLFLGLFGFFLGMQGVIFNYLLSKLIPVEKRGSLTGLRNFLSGLTAMAVAWWSGSYLVENNVLGNGYAATFLVAFVLTSLGLAVLLMLREPEPPEVRRAAPLFERLRELPELVRSDRHFALYFLCRALGTMGRMATPFYILYAQKQVEIGGLALGQLTAAYILAQTVSNLGWGWVADRSGFRLIFLAAMGLWITATAALLISPQLEILIGAFVGLGAGQGGFMLASQNLVLEFGEREDLPMRIAVVNSGTELVGAIGPLLAGLLVSLWSYAAIFWIAIGFQCMAMFTMAVYVRDPRSRVKAH